MAAARGHTYCRLDVRAPPELPADEYDSCHVPKVTTVPGRVPPYREMTCVWNSSRESDTLKVTVLSAGLANVFAVAHWTT